MGLIRIGPPTELVLELRDTYKLRDFVETGTYKGGTAIWAAAEFNHVVTIEYAREIYDSTKSRFEGINNIRFLHGDSRTELVKVVSEIGQPALFWLDSHWSVGTTYGENDECPLLEEIRVINSSNHAHFLFIDDARQFMSPPPHPHNLEQWPTLAQVLDILRAGTHEYYIVIFEDVLIAVPVTAKKTVAVYCQDANTKAWHNRQKSRARQGLQLIAESARDHLPLLRRNRKSSFTEKDSNNG